MKKRVKGLIALWFAVVLLFHTTVLAADTVEVLIYLRNDRLEEGEGEWSEYKRGTLELDTPLNQQTAIMSEINVPSGYILNGWKFWNYDSGMLADPSEENNLDIGVTQEVYDGYTKWGYLLLEPLFSPKYRISQQPSSANAYTAAGEETADGGLSWSGTQDIAYQWYESTVKNKTYALGESDTEDEIAVSDSEGGSYDSGTKSWTAEYEENYGSAFMALPFDVLKGDVIRLKFSDADTNVLVYFDGDDQEVQGGECLLTATVEGSFGLMIEGESTFTCTITLERTSVTNTLLAGQNSASLTAGEDGKQYICECVFNPDGNAVALRTQPVTYQHTHTWSKDYEADENGHWFVCTGCGQEGEKSSHSFTGEVTKEPTCTKEGVRTYTCTQCKKEKTESIKASGHQFADGVCTVCGETDPDHTHRYENGFCVICGAKDPGFVETEIAGNASAVTVDKKNLENAVLSSDDREQIQNGASVTIRLVVNDASDSVKDSDKTATENESKKGKFTVGRYLDISLVKIIEKDSTTTEASVHNTGNLVRIVIEIPQDLRMTGRTFAVIRIHNGESSVLNDLDDNPDTITIETDRFSSYAIVYQNEVPSETPDEPTKPVEPTNPVNPTEPATEPTNPTEPVTEPTSPTEPVTEPTSPVEPTAAPSDEYDEDENEEETVAAVAAVSPRTSDTSPVVPVTVVLIVSGAVLCFMIAEKKKKVHLQK